MRKIFIITIFLLTFSVFANAQAQMVYHYLEVIDSNKKAIPDAKVEMRINRDSSESSQTDKDGKAQIKVWYPNGLGAYASVFTITKSGYFPFYDFGLVLGRFDYYNIKLELFKIPKTEQERKSLGKEQLKREFITAVRNGDIEAVRNRLKSGISPNLTTKELKGITLERSEIDIPALAFPIVMGHGAVVKLLLEKGANLSNLSNKEINSRQIVTNSRVLVYYLKADYDTRTYNISDEKERGKLIQKIEQERNDGLKSLIKAGAKVNISSEDISKHYLSPPLIIALDKGYVSVAKILIDNGADINAQDAEGKTALMSAVNEGLVDGVKLLIEKGADVNAKNKSGITALAIANYRIKTPYSDIQDMYKEIVKLLELAGAKE